MVERYAEIVGRILPSEARIINWGNLTLEMAIKESQKGEQIIVDGDTGTLKLVTGSRIIYEDSNNISRPVFRK